MIRLSSAEATVNGEDFWWTESFPVAVSCSSTATVRRLPGQVETLRSKKKPWYGKNSFWALPPLDFGDVRSDRLDDYLY